MNGLCFNYSVQLGKGENEGVQLPMPNALFVVLFLVGTV